jgi:arylsulfatase
MPAEENELRSQPDVPREVSRRTFLRLSAIAAAGASLARPGIASSAYAVPVGSQPEGPRRSKLEKLCILWIMCDELRADALGSYGNRWIKTPYLDDIAQRGIVFTSAYVQSPICVPSRASMLTGRYPHTLDVLDNNDRLADREVLFPEIFFRHGWQTVNIGKLHHRGARPGFQYNLQMEWGEEASAFELRRGLDPKKYNVGVLPAGPVIIYGTNPEPADRTMDAVKVDYATEFLKKRARLPFLMRVSLNFPHTPVLPPEPYDRLYDPERMELPVVAPQELDAKPQVEKLFRQWMGVSKLTEKQLRLARGHYYGLVSYVDSLIGRLLVALRETGLDKSTIIVFTADHGTLLGEHGLFFKGVFYRPITNVPLIISAPGILPQGKVIEELVELVDLAPTLLEMAGIEVPSNMHGRSLVPLIRGETKGRHEVFSEIRNTFGSLGERGSRDSISRSVRTKEWFYVSVSEGGKHVDGALYDLKKDTEEIHNLYYDARYRETVKALEEVLENWLNKTAPGSGSSGR